MVHAYRERKNVEGYARLVPIKEIEAEDYNCNIRRYVDNAPPPEPHDVRAHLHGGVPKVEVESLAHFWQNYPQLKDDAFDVQGRTNAAGAGCTGAAEQMDQAYLDFAPVLAGKRDIADFVASHQSVISRHAEFMQTLEDWWQANLPIVEALAPGAANQQGKPRNVYVMRRSLLAGIEQALAGQRLLTPFQVRGAFANYVDVLKADFKSIAASGWGPELIPDEDILLSQFPEVLEALEQAQTRLAELQALFAAADDEDFEDSDDTGVMNSDQVKSLKARLKEAKGMAKLCKRDPNSGDTALYQREAEQIEAQLERHKKLEDEVKTLRATIKGIEGKRDELVQSAREKISTDEARIVIIERLRQQLVNTYRAYLRADQRACIKAIENLWSKYAVTAKTIEAERDAASQQLQEFLQELGYE
jgi:type I restriction enzyme M protein